MVTTRSVTTKINGPKFSHYLIRVHSIRSPNTLAFWFLTIVHILVQLKKKSKLELNRLEVHRKINSLLIKEFEGGLHSLEIKII